MTTESTARPPADGPDYSAKSTDEVMPNRSNKKERIIPHYYISIRNKILLIGVGIPTILLSLLGGTLFVLLQNLWTENKEKMALYAQVQSLQKEENQTKNLLQTLVNDQSKITTTAETVARTVNVLVGAHGVTSESVTPYIQQNDRVIYTGMKENSDGIKMSVRGTPFQLHQFFAALEKEFPSITVMSTTITKPRDMLTIETTYLIPSYDPLRR